MRTLQLCAAGLLVIAFAACGDSDDNDRHVDENGGKDAAVEKDAALPPLFRGEPGVCNLADCPVPLVGSTCCTPAAQCGTDLLGLGLGCLPLAGQAPSDRICDLSKCDDPDLGIACCTTNGICGADLYGTGLMCTPILESPEPADAGAQLCDVEECPFPALGFRCCTIDDRCGIDLYGIGWCLPNPPEVDAGPPQEITGPPEDPSVTGECPSFLGPLGPVWGCCSAFGVCGTFQADQCLLPVGTALPVPGTDAGDTRGQCTPPPRD